ncbi:MAG: hypothetical protein LBG72_07680 [Spirochaetaceae bacterium]|jgi:hypothetical protein|nr:hypothetical protein [Spirochaetaceae bacterium]
MISFLIFFLFIFDSGGNIGIRNIGFLLMGICVLEILLKNKIIINRYFLIFWVGIVSFLLVNLAVAMQNGAEFLNANVFSFSMYMLVFFYILARNNYLDIEGYLNAVKVFAVFVIVFFLGRLLGINIIVEIYRFVPSVTGPDGTKNGMAVVYYQGTLALVPGSVMFACQKKTGWFLICVIALAAAQSRFGLFTSILFFLIIYRKKIYIPAMLALAVMAVIAVFQVEIPVLTTFLEMFNGRYSGSQIRQGHLYSILALLRDNPAYILFGQGAGTSFYTSGFNTYTDSVEISHFDFMRKYGVLFFGILSLALLWIIFVLFKKRQARQTRLAFALMAHYVVAISNPVLMSLPIMMLMCVAIVEAEQKRCVFVHS